MLGGRPMRPPVYWSRATTAAVKRPWQRIGTRILWWIAPLMKRRAKGHLQRDQLGAYTLPGRVLPPGLLARRDFERHTGGPLMVSPDRGAQWGSRRPSVHVGTHGERKAIDRGVRWNTIKRTDHSHISVGTATLCGAMRNGLLDLDTILHRQGSIAASNAKATGLREPARRLVHHTSATLCF